MPLELWTPREIYALNEDERNTALPSYILDTFFTQTHFSEDGEILFADLPEQDRFVAPFVLPYEQGKPLQIGRSENIRAITPPYIKLKNAVRPEDARNVLPSEVFRNGGRRPSLQERFNARVAQVNLAQNRAIDMREIWMAARAFFDGKVQIDYDRDQGTDHPSVLLDFGRDPGHTIVKTGDFWDDPDSDILGDLEAWMTRQYLAYGGGSAYMLLVGAKVAPVFRKNNGIKAALDTNFRGNNSVEIDLGILRTNQPLNRIGQLTTGLEVFSYKDTIDIPLANGQKQRVDLLNENDVVLIAPGATGVRAYGAIYDTKALGQGIALSTRVFPKMFETDDPGEAFIMNQSSPLPIPLNPNRTLKARVLNPTP